MFYYILHKVNILKVGILGVDILGMVPSLRVDIFESRNIRMSPALHTHGKLPPVEL